MSTMRRPEKAIRDRREMERILGEAEVGRLGTCADGEPYVVPLSFAYHDGKIFFHCAKQGKKLDHIARNPRVCFEVDSGEVIRKEKPCNFSVRYESVIAYGDARICAEPTEMLRVLRLLTDKYAPGGMSGQLTLEDLSKYRNLSLIHISEPTRPY